MTTRTRVTGAMDEQIRYLYLERRLTDREIAAVLGTTRVTVTRHRLAMGVRPSDRPSPLAMAE